ncbi:polysaccharide deacetylase family protein [Pseudorhodoferax sp.]|uniref:polysaccharide deacetylase family protein n=1 Tax=Pseudorhodoferax sp. TaxID=1993553 RepID=UPI002DD6773E|nr:polysaccharide deacetylase family protein [Pseudorhodoferax sp.]
MKHGLRIAALRLARAAGLFALARRATRDEARIVCYHGYAYRDEHRFVPQLFMAPATFERRLHVIARSRLRVVPLDELVSRLEQGRPVGGLLCLTIDDGWTGFARFAWPALKQRGWPCTLYLTTWYAIRGWPVLNVLRRYLAWRGVALAPEAESPAAERALLQQAAGQAGIDLSCPDGQLFCITPPAELAALVQQGLDLQVHTHRHRLPSAPDALAAEIDDNRRHLAEAGNPRADHLCYPSGEYTAAQIPLLAGMGLRSATTTQPGLVNTRSDRWQLPRLLDSDHLHDVEFEAELSGLLSLVRRALGRSPTPAPPGMQ